MNRTPCHTSVSLIEEVRYGLHHWGMERYRFLADSVPHYLDQHYHQLRNNRGGTAPMQLFVGVLMFVCMWTVVLVLDQFRVVLAAANVRMAGDRFYVDETREGPLASL